MTTENFGDKERAEFIANWDDEPTANEAWKCMTYACDECSHRERIWNARPHVTPFGGVRCDKCGASMTHVEWGTDTYEPERMPEKGDLIFIDLPPELALIYARRTVKQAIKRYGPPDGKTDLEYAKELALSSLSDFGGHPPYCMRLTS